MARSRRQPARAAARPGPWTRPVSGWAASSRSGYGDAAERAGRARRPRGARPARPGLPGRHASTTSTWSGRARARAGAAVDDLRGAARARARARAAGLLHRGDGRARADPQGRAPARRDRAAAGVRAARRPAAAATTTSATRGGRRADRRDPAVAVRRRAAAGRRPYGAQRASTARRAAAPGRCSSRSRTSRWSRPSGVRRPRWRCCVDLSFSMVLRGRWGPMKQTALALHAPGRDAVPAGRAADHRLRPDRAGGSRRVQLADVEPDMVQGTNLQHALMLAAAAPAPAPRRRAGRAGGHRRRADRAPRRRRRAGVPLADRCRRRCGRPSAEVDELTRCGATHQLLHARRRPGAGAVRRRDGPPQRRPGLHPRPRRGSGEYVVSRLPPRPPRPPLTRRQLRATAPTRRLWRRRTGRPGDAGAGTALLGDLGVGHPGRRATWSRPVTATFTAGRVTRRLAAQPGTRTPPNARRARRIPSPASARRRAWARTVVLRGRATTSQPNRSAQVLRAAEAAARRAGWNASPSYSQPKRSGTPRSSAVDLDAADRDRDLRCRRGQARQVEPPQPQRRLAG